MSNNRGHLSESRVLDNHVGPDVWVATRREIAEFMLQQPSD